MWVEKCSGTGDDRECHMETETRYHNCPVCTEEWAFYVDTTLGSYTIAKHWLPTNPDQHRWIGVGYDEWELGRAVNRGAQSGEPAFWLGVLERTKNNTVPGGPVSAIRQYDNYILASQNTLLKAHSSDIKRFLAAGLLPPMNYGVHEFYWTDKVHFVGWQPENPQEWQTAFHYLAAALGTDREGDPRLVIIQNDEVSANPAAYILALKAYWQTAEWKNEEGKMVRLWGDNCLSKNGVIIVVGTRDGQTVDWARLQTTMPQGNEWLEDTDLVNRTLKGLPLTPEAIIGAVRGEYYTKTYTDGRPPKQKIRGVFSGGAIAQLLWGLTPEGEKDPGNPGFIRVSMSGDDPEDVGTGYLFLEGEIQPTSGQKTGIVIGVFFLCLVGWVVVALRGEREDWGRRHRRHRRYDRRNYRRW